MKKIILLFTLLMSAGLSLADETIFPLGMADFESWNKGTFDVNNQTVTLNSQWQSLGWNFSPTKDCSAYIQLVLVFDKPTTHEFGIYVQCDGSGNNPGGTVSVGSTRFIITLDPNRRSAIEAFYFFSWLADVIAVKLTDVYFVSLDDDEDDGIVPYEGKYIMRENFTTQKLIEEMGLGINLGNTFEANGTWINPSSIYNYEQAWGSPIITKKMITGYAKAGFSSLRIPVNWSNMMLEDYQIHPDLLDRIDAIVDWTINCGMVALINMHHENEWIIEIPTNNAAKAKYIAIWKQICERFEKYGDRLMFESMNEVGFDSIWTPWNGGASAKAKAFGYVNDINQLFVDIVRSSGGNNAKRHLLIEVYNTGLEYAYDPLFKMPTDSANRMAATVHYYSPATFAILEADADWGKARDTWGTAADFKELNDNMDLLKKNCVDKGLPIIVGEYAACGNNKTQEMVRLYAVSVTEAVYSRGMCPMLWDTPGWQYDRQTYQFKDPLFLKEMMAIPNENPRNSQTSVLEVSKPEILLYPNPAQGQLNIAAELDTPTIISFVSMAGQVAKIVHLTERTIDVNDLASGTYIVRIQSRRVQYTQKLIIK